MTKKASIFLMKNVEPASGFWTVRFRMPPAAPKVIQVKVLRTLVLEKPERGFI